MDLERLGRPDFAAAFVAAYVAASGDRELPVLLPFYGAYRACVRGAVDGLKAAEPEVAPVDRRAAASRARDEFALAVRYAWRECEGAVVACCGLSGTGKTAIATALATATGFRHLSSDVLRGEHSASAGGDAYTPAARAAVYERLCEQADRILDAGGGVVADATFIRRADRDALASVAARHGRPLLFIECDAPERVVRERLAARTGGPSDARWPTYLQQRAERDPFAETEPRHTISTVDPLPGLVDDLLLTLWRRADRRDDPQPA